MLGQTMSTSGAGTAHQHEWPSAIAGPGRCSRWSEVFASLVFSAATCEMHVLYGIVHWQIMFRLAFEAPNAPEAVFTVLGHISVLRLGFAVLALVWAVWSFRRAPRWAAWVALVTAIAALCSNAIAT